MKWTLSASSSVVTNECICNSVIFFLKIIMRFSHIYYAVLVNNRRINILRLAYHHSAFRRRFNLEETQPYNLFWILSRKYAKTSRMGIPSGEKESSALRSSSITRVVRQGADVGRHQRIFFAVIFDSNSLLNWCNSISALIRVRICIPDNFIPDLHKWIFIRSFVSISSDYTLNIRYLFAVSFPNTGKFISERNFSWNFSRFLSGVSNRRDIVIFSKSLYSSATHKIDECIIRAAVGFHRESGPFFRL